LTYNYICLKGGVSLKLAELLGDYPAKITNENNEIDILGIEHNSKKIQQGFIFVAQKGFTVDGHKFIQSAIENGARALVVDQDVGIEEDIIIIRVENSTDALAYLSGRFYNKPWEKMETIGVTGTNGKTSVTYFAKSIFDRARKETALLGTNGGLIKDRKINLANTTPDSLTIYKIMNQMVTSGVEYCFLEVTSHALELKRVEYMDFQIGVFTNLTKDHLDYHQSMENYFQSKLKLFLRTKKHNIINIDDPYGRRIIDSIGERVPYTSYGIKNKADINAKDIKHKDGKLYFTLEIYGKVEELILNNPCEFNIYNLLPAIACANLYNIGMETIKPTLEEMKQIKGRFEIIPNKKDFIIIIDFAHTPDGLEKVLIAMEKFTKGRRIVLFGAGGNRDKSKRPEMGEIAGKHSDLVIVTSDNPRKEDPEKIINDILVGIKRTNVEYITITDRRKAIEYALKIAKAKDSVLLAGKGHEEYTIIGGVKYPFSEYEIVLETLKTLE